MFQTDFFESFSHIKWYHIFFVPFIIFTMYWMKIDWAEYDLFKMLPFFILGVFTFSLTEYLLHRFIFHSEKHLFDNRLMRYLHFVIHGIHHMLPVDPDRIVFPPSLALITISIGYSTVYQVINFSN